MTLLVFWYWLLTIVGSIIGALASKFAFKMNVVLNNKKEMEYKFIYAIMFFFEALIGIIFNFVPIYWNYPIAFIMYTIIDFLCFFMIWKLHGEKTAVYKSKSKENEKHHKLNNGYYNQDEIKYVGGFFLIINAIQFIACIPRVSWTSRLEDVLLQMIAYVIVIIFCFFIGWFYPINKNTEGENKSDTLIQD